MRYPLRGPSAWGRGLLPSRSGTGELYPWSAGVRKGNGAVVVRTGAVRQGVVDGGAEGVDAPAAARGDVADVAGDGAGAIEQGAGLGFGGGGGVIRDR